ncbi:hypothetical protein PAPYR_13171 [Paratrimastix pyriformis]|uniref:Uncharacterized protein n=1 Tax=Paratrimastix pyriformis TaxID=342808 RepID=A0ABQ8U5S3_9EUKA|nr:hypothetical protein PAPYR_13171 [Paratrimastix pyriformis]
MCDHFDDLINVATHFDIVLMNLQIDDNFFEKTQIIDICEDQFDRLNSIVDEIRDMNCTLLMRAGVVARRKKSFRGPTPNFFSQFSGLHILPCREIAKAKAVERYQAEIMSLFTRTAFGPTFGPLIPDALYKSSDPPSKAATTPSPIIIQAPPAVQFPTLRYPTPEDLFNFETSCKLLQTQYPAASASKNLIEMCSPTVIAFLRATTRTIPANNDELLRALREAVRPQSARESLQLLDAFRLDSRLSTSERLCTRLATHTENFERYCEILGVSDPCKAERFLSSIEGPCSRVSVDAIDIEISIEKSPTLWPPGFRGQTLPTRPKTSSL